MTNQLERIWKEVYMAYSRYYPYIFLERPRKNTNKSVMIAGAPTEIRTEYLVNTSLERYRFASPFGTRT
jgi:hypothetical protein